MKRHYFYNNNLKLSYLDSGGGGEILIALHAHWIQAINFKALANELKPQFRVLALDQRGHGHSDHADSYTREDYLNDITAFFQHLNIKKPAVLLGNSLGGINAYQFAAKNPHLVRAMIIEDIGVDISGDVSFSLKWQGVFKTKEELEELIGLRFLPYLENSIHQTEQGWKLMFDPEEMITSHNHVYAQKYWEDWIKTDCPCLLLRGKDSRVTTQDQLEQMAFRRPNTNLQVLNGSHVLHLDNPKEFTKAVKDFLQTIDNQNT